MGLDMYLYATYFFSRWTKDKVEITYKQKEESTVKDEFKFQMPKKHKIIEVKIDVGYWRKANHIHNWFVENVQDGKDDCQEVWVERKKLKELMAICKKIVKETVTEKTNDAYGGFSIEEGGMKRISREGEKIINPEIAESLLPRVSGCFFGNTEYDDDYLYDIKQTIKILKYALSLPPCWDIYYRASW